LAVIEYFYAAHSAFAYIGSAELQRIADQGGHRLLHKPYDLRRALKALAPGDIDRTVGNSATGSWTPARSAYFFGREIPRWAEYRGVAIRNGVPTYHANDIGLPNRLLIAALARGHSIDRLAHSLLEAHWLGDADLADPQTLVTLATRVGFDGHDLLAAASTTDVTAKYEANTQEAIARHVFGSPTYFVGDDMFYGQDRLELVARALRQPFAGAWPPTNA
jgi:2-hydroxychromene-2-carboxylate isomerase